MYPPGDRAGRRDDDDFGPIPEQLPGRLMRLQPLAKLAVFRARARQHAYEAPAAPIDMIHRRFGTKFTVRDMNKKSARPVALTRVSQVAGCVRLSLVLPSSQRNCTGTAPSAVVVSTHRSCLRSGRWAFDQP